MRAFQTVVFTLSRLASGFSCVLLVAMVVHINAEIVLRTFFDTSTFVLEEIVAYEMAAMTFLALGYTLETGGLIRVTLLLGAVASRPHLRRAIECVCAATTLAAFALPIVFFWRSIWSSYESGYTTGTILNLQQWIPEAFVLVGLVLFWIQLLAYTLRVLDGEVDLTAADTQAARSE